MAESSAPNPVETLKSLLRGEKPNTPEDQKYFIDTLYAVYLSSEPRPKTLKELTDSLGLEKNDYFKVRRWFQEFCLNQAVSENCDKFPFNKKSEESANGNNSNKRQSYQDRVVKATERNVVVASMIRTPSRRILNRLRDFVFDPGVAELYNWLSRTSISVKGKDIPLINAFLGIDSERPISFETAINTVFIRYFAEKGVRVGMVLDRDLRDLIESKFGIKLKGAVFHKNIMIYPAVHQEVEEVKKENGK